MGLDRMIVIGGGNMARAILSGAIARGAVRAETLAVVEPDAQRLKHFQTLGVQGFASADAIRDRLTPGAVVMLAVKPQMLASVGESIGDAGFGGLVISILAGMTSDRVGAAMGGRCRVVRVMPNTPALLGMGISGVSKGVNATGADVELVSSLFRGVGEVINIDENDLDAVTAVSGSGPAYVFLLAQAMIEGAVGVGLEPGVARRLVLATIRGGAEMLVRSEDTPEELRRAVTSPRGTTEAAIGVMEREDLRGIVARAVRTARDRGAELGRG